MASETTALPTEPQPLPMICFVCATIINVHFNEGDRAIELGRKIPNKKRAILFVRKNRLCEVAHFYCSKIKLRSKSFMGNFQTLVTFVIGLIQA